MMGEPDSEILHLAKKWAEAIVSNDVAAVGSFMADDWVIVGQDGATSKSDFLALIASGDLTHQMLQMVGEGRVRVYGDSAVLTGRVVNSGHFKGQAFEVDEWTTDVFVRCGTRWVCALSHVAAARAPPTAD